MKKQFLLLLTLLLCFTVARADVTINSTNFPDANFRSYMLSLYPKGYMTTAEVNALTSINVADKGIANMKGIEHLTALTELHCIRNSFTSLDLRSNTALTVLDCASNPQLTYVNLSNCTMLKSIYCHSTGITSLDVSNFNRLNYLFCDKTKLTSINCYNCPNLQWIDCSDNNDLTTLNLAYNISLSWLYCNNNPKLETITNLAHCTNMQILECENCALTDLSAVQSMTYIQKLYAGNNKFDVVELNSLNQLEEISLRGNDLLTDVEIYACSSLHTLDIDDCVSLTTLWLEENALTSLSVYNDLLLENLNCNFNQLTSLDVAGLFNLTSLECNGNKLTAIDLQDCAALTYLDCGYNDDLIELDLADCTALETLLCSRSRLTSLDVTGLNLLVVIYCPYNQLTTLDVSNHALLSKLDVSGNSLMTRLNCQNCALPSINLQGCSSLTELWCAGNQINAANMTTLVNSLPTRSASIPGRLYAFDETNNVEGNVFNTAHSIAAQAKYWNAKKFNGSDWVDVSPRGDVNWDGTVSISDVTTLIDYLLSGYAAGVNLEGADVNKDGNVTISDVTALIDYLLSGVWPLTQTTYTVNGVSFKMVDVEGGTFTMGATAEQGSEAKDDEKPAHQVTLSSFAIGQTEVTQALWQAVMGSNPSHIPGDLNRPVENVSWDDCQTFITKLNQMTGLQFRLPTEAEWEYATRGGNLSKGYKYAGSNTIDEVAWYSDNASGKPHVVGTKAPNELGLYDMSGNVWEWCQDWYNVSYYSSSPSTNPTGPSSGSFRVCRGGSWYSHAWYCRVSNRNLNRPSDTYYYQGLRLAL